MGRDARRGPFVRLRVPLRSLGAEAGDVVGATGDLARYLALNGLGEPVDAQGRPIPVRWH